jgi:hypothetical protein
VNTAPDPLQAVIVFNEKFFTAVFFNVLMGKLIVD